LDNLREAAAIGRTFARAEATREGRLDDLAERLAQRNPDAREDISAKRELIDTELTAKRDEIKAPTVEITDDQKAERSGVMREHVGEKVQREANREALLRELGIERDADGKDTLVEGGIEDRRLKAEATYIALDAEYKKALEAAKEDPRLADRALSLALMRHEAGSVQTMVRNEANQAIALARAAEEAQIEGEKAKAEDDKAKAERAVAWAKGVAQARTAAATATAFIGKVAGDAGERFFGMLARKSKEYADKVRGKETAKKEKIDKEAKDKIDPKDQIIADREKRIKELEEQLARAKGETKA
jgi:hypothetical protein